MYENMNIEELKSEMNINESGLSLAYNCEFHCV